MPEQEQPAILIDAKIIKDPKALNQVLDQLDGGKEGKGGVIPPELLRVKGPAFWKKFDTWLGNQEEGPENE